MDEMMANLATYGYIILFFYSFGGGMFALAAAGVLSSLGKMDVTTSVAVAATSNFLGDMILVYLGRYNKAQVMGYFKKHRRKLALSHLLMRRYGTGIIFLQKYVYGVKTLVPLAIGISKYDLRRFALFNLPASAIWGVVVGFGAYFAGEAVVRAADSAPGWIMPLFLAAIIGGTLFYVNRITRK